MSRPDARCARARLRDCINTTLLLHFPVRDVLRATDDVRSPCTVRVPRRCGTVGGEDENFASRDMHHDTCLGGNMFIYEDPVSIRATVRPRRGEQMKEILSRISW